MFFTSIYIYEKSLDPKEKIMHLSVKYTCDAYAVHRQSSRLFKKNDMRLLPLLIFMGCNFKNIELPIDGRDLTNKVSI